MTDMIACPAPDFQPRKPRFVFPALACDSHAHILGPVAKYDYSPERVYTPPDCLIGDYEHLLATLGVQRAVLVQPSVYAADNAAMLAALAHHQATPRSICWRAVVVVEPDIEVAQLEHMHALGVRGVRVNLVDVKAEYKTPGNLPLALLKPLAQKIAPLGWHMEFLAHVDEYPHLDIELADFPVPVVFGHLGYAKAQGAKDKLGFQALLSLMRAGKAWVKLTGPYRISTASLSADSTLTYEHVAPLAQALLAAAPDRVVWGTDWPHVMHKGPMPNDADIADLISQWVPDPAIRQKVLVDNPAVLYQF